ncbi:MAG: FAD-dependent oxidoreductase, partial [Candidatus Eremiobacteraeota bacterium]|nr:FAD-dependent oxidoreductase [Candidatus Eremiobacteraeota bacterium]
AGVDVVVLEKQADFFRDFRGDTIHSSTLEVMDELGLLADLLRIPHSEVAQLSGRIGNETLQIADFSHVPGRCKFIALMPQWDLLNFLAEQGRRYAGFHLEMQAQALDLVHAGDRVCGVQAQTPSGPLTVNAELVVAADGRHSTLREVAKLPIRDIGAPIDVLWMRLSRHPDDPGQTFGNITSGGILVAIDRREYYQCAFVIRKGEFADIQAGGLENFRTTVARVAPSLADRVQEIRSWDDIKLLTVMIDRLQTWYLPGFLCIGDAAHAMSPVGGVGINLAIQDAVAAANVLAIPLRRGAITTRLLWAVQHRREFATRMTQWLQVQVQKRILGRVLSTSTPIRVPAWLRFLFSLPMVRRIPARIVGVGFRAEHVRTPDAGAIAYQSAPSPTSI